MIPASIQLAAIVAAATRQPLPHRGMGWRSAPREFRGAGRAGPYMKKVAPSSSKPAPQAVATGVARTIIIGSIRRRDPGDGVLKLS
jgi:hypothetical protein